MQIFTCTGSKVEPYLEALAQLRIAVFQEYPYLYAGDLAYEADYLRHYAQTPDSLLVIAQDGQQIVGVATGMPLLHQPEAVQAPFRPSPYPIEAVFYYGESVLLPSYRGRGIGVAFFHEREAFARRLARFQWASFCAVVRPATHPQKPVDYSPLNAFWQKRGFAASALYCSMSWPDLGAAAPSSKPMQFWIKGLH